MRLYGTGQVQNFVCAAHAELNQSRDIGIQLIAFDLAALNSQRIVIEHQFSFDGAKGQLVLVQHRR